MHRTLLVHVYGWLLLLPAAVLLIAFTHYPAVASLAQSFFSPASALYPSKFVGLDNYATMAADTRRLQDAFTAVAKIPKPVVAAITGYALGGGLELALCADFRVAGESARVGQPEILLGVIPGAGGTQRLPRLVGPARAKDIVYTGRFVSAPEALAIGLVDKVVPDAEVYQAAREMVQRGETLIPVHTSSEAGHHPPDRRIDVVRG